jgi:hypothetical protein
LILLLGRWKDEQSARGNDGARHQAAALRLPARRLEFFYVNPFFNIIFKNNSQQLLLAQRDPFCHVKRTSTTGPLYRATWGGVAKLPCWPPRRATCCGAAELPRWPLRRAASSMTLAWLRWARLWRATGLSRRVRWRDKPITSRRPGSSPSLVLLQPMPDPLSPSPPAAAALRSAPNQPIWGGKSRGNRSPPS